MYFLSFYFFTNNGLGDVCIYSTKQSIALTLLENKSEVVNKLLPNTYAIPKTQYWVSTAPRTVCVQYCSHTLYGREAPI